MLGSYGRGILSVVLFIVLAVVDRSRRNLAADHVSRDDHFYATIQLTALGCAVAGGGIGFAHALLEARNAVAIAKAAGARQYAPDSLAKAEDMLQRAEDYYQRKQGRTPIGTAARGATQMAEDARVLTLRRKEQEKLDAEKRASQEAQEKAEADCPGGASRRGPGASRAAAIRRLLGLLLGGLSLLRGGFGLSFGLLQLGTRDSLYKNVMLVGLG